MDQWKSHRLHTIKYRVCVATRRYAQHRFLDSRLGYGNRRRRDRARSRAVVAREHTLLDGARGAINRLRVVRTVDTCVRAKVISRESDFRAKVVFARDPLSSKVATKIAIKLHKKEIRIFYIRPRRTLTMPSRTRRARRSSSNAPPPMGPKARLFLDTLVVGMNQAEEGLLYASVGNPPSIAFPVPAEHKPDGMGVASVSEAGIEMPCGGSFPFEDGDKFKGNTPESLACLLLGSILSGNPITVRCPECEKDTCSRCGHVRN